VPPKPPRLFHLLSLAQHRLLKYTDAAFKEALGISHTQLGVLFILEKKPGAMLKEVSEELGINASAITALIDRMEDAGWIERRPDPGDRRAHRLVLTEKARPILARILDLSTEIRNEAFAGLSKAEGQHLIDLLVRVHGNLSERVPPLAAGEFTDLDEPDNHVAPGAAITAADLSLVGGQR